MKSAAGSMGVLMAWFGHRLGCRALALIWLALGSVPGAGAQDGASALLARREALQPQLRASPFGLPLVLDSREAPDSVSGEVLAELPFGEARVRKAFGSGAELCDVLVLHLNIHGCRSQVRGTAEQLVVLAGPKRARGTVGSREMVYTLQQDAAGPGHARATLSAPEGPMGTTDHRIVLEVVALGAERSFVRVAYGYRFGTWARTAMSMYLATAGRNKVGFTVVGRDAQGQPLLLQGERAALERNVMRYLLALQAYCATDELPAADRAEARLRHWFALTERYARQLRELSLAEYLEEKRSGKATAGDVAR